MPDENVSLMTLDDQPREITPLQEFHTDQGMMRAQKEVEAAIMVAQRFKRKEDDVYQSLMRACKRTTFAERAEYSYPRGKKLDEATGTWVDNIISGPSVYLSREMVRLWGNIQVYTEILRDTEDERMIRSVAWDMQTNTKRYTEASFRKLVQRKKKEMKNGKMKDIWPPQTEWVRPDERDLRELHGKFAAIGERNVSLQLMPDDFIYDARVAARATLLIDAEKDPDAAKKKIILAFGELNIPISEVEEVLGHPLGSSSPTELVNLRQMWAGIRDGNTTWAEIRSAKTELNAELVIKSLDAAAFFTAYKESGWTTKQASDWMGLHLKDGRGEKLTDAMKMQPKDLPAAMVFARTKASDTLPGLVVPPEAPAAAATTAPEATQGEKEVAGTTTTEEAVPPKLEQLFGISGIKGKDRAKMLKDFAGRLGQLEAELEDKLPKD